MAKKPTGGLLKSEKRKIISKNRKKTYQGGEEPQKKYKQLSSNSPKYRSFLVVTGLFEIGGGR